MQGSSLKGLMAEDCAPSAPSSWVHKSLLEGGSRYHIRVSTIGGLVFSPLAY